MNKQEILAKCTNEDDKLLISKLFDKMEFTIKRNTVEHTDFLDMRQRQLLEKVLYDIKFNNYVATGGYKSLFPKYLGSPLPAAFIDTDLYFLPVSSSTRVYDFSSIS